MPSDLPITKPAAAASSSATARMVASSGFEWRSRVPRRSRSTGIPAAPMATLVRPSRQGRPNVSLMITAMRFLVSLRISAAILRAEPSGSRGRRVTTSSPSTLEWSTPALAQTNPWCVSTISTGCSLTIRRDSRKIISTRRGSLPAFDASCDACAEGSIVESLASRPSALETTFWATTRISPLRKAILALRAAAAIRRVKSLPSRISGSPATDISSMGTPGCRLESLPLAFFAMMTRTEFIRSARLMHRLASRDDYGSGTFRYSKNESGGACHAANAPPDLRLEERLPLWWLVFVFFLGFVLLFRLLLLLTRSRLLTLLRLRRALLLLLHLLLLTRGRLLAPLLLICRPIVDRRAIWLRVGRRCIGAVAYWCAVRLRIGRLRIRPVVVGARRSWAIVPLIVWLVVVGRRRSRLIIHRRTVWLHVSWPLCVQRRRIRSIVLWSIATFAAWAHVVLGLTRPVARIVLRFRRPRWGRHPHGCRNGFLLRFNLSRLGNGKRLPTILPDGNLLPFHRGWRGRWRSPCHYGAVFNPLGWVRRCWPPSSNKRLPLRRHGRSLHCDLRAGHLSLISPYNVPCHRL